MAARRFTEADITPEMMAAGRKAYDSFDPEDSDYRIIWVFLEMATTAGLILSRPSHRERPENPPPPSN